MKLYVHTPSSVLLIMLVVVIGAVPAISATNYVWTGAIDADWDNAGNWNSNGVPVDRSIDKPAYLSFDYSAGERLAFNSFGANPVPTSNIPLLGGLTTRWPTNNTPVVDLLNGTLSFVLDGQNFVLEDNPTASVGDGDTGNGTASLTFSLDANANNEMVPFGTITWIVNADGILSFTNQHGGVCKLESSSNGAREPYFFLNGGDLVFDTSVDMWEGNPGNNDAYVEFQADGSSFTALFGDDFPDIASVEAQIGAGKFFRSTTGEDPVATDNGDGTYTVAFPAAFITLSSDHVASNAVPGSLVGTLSCVTNDQSGITYTLPITANGPDSASFQIIGTTNLRTAVSITTNSYAISIAASKDGTPLETNDFTITVDPVASDYHAFVVDAEVNYGEASGGELIGELQSVAGDPSAMTYSLVSGRTDLFEITDDTNVVQIAGTHPGSLGSVHYLEIQADNSATTNHLVVAVEVVSSVASATTFRFR